MALLLSPRCIRPSRMLVNEPDYEPIHQSALYAVQLRGQWLLRVAQICKYQWTNMELPSLINRRTGGSCNSRKYSG
jgi:hypothetical protein